MLDGYEPEIMYMPDLVWTALDPNYSGGDNGPIDWDNLDFEPPQIFEDWQLDLIENLFDLIAEDPNVKPLLDWYSEIQAPGDLLTQVIEYQTAEGMIASANDGYYDDWIFSVQVEYIYHTTDWDRFFEDYAAIF